MIIFNAKQSLPAKVMLYLLPSGPELGLCVSAAALLLFLVNYSTIGHILAGKDAPAVNEAIVLTDKLTVIIYKLTQGFGLATIFMFWFFVGGLLYALYWFLRSVSYNLRNSPPYPRGPFWLSPLAQQLAFASVIISVPGYLYFCIFHLQPLFSHFALAWLLVPSPSNYVVGLAAVLAFAVDLYIFYLLLRIFKFTVQAKGYR